LLYEIASGRPVVLNQSLQPTPTPGGVPSPAHPSGVPLASPAAPPLVPMFTPRPVLQTPSGNTSRPGSMSFIPPHVLSSLQHHPHGVTPDFASTPVRYGPGPYSAASPAPGEPSRATPTFFVPPKSGGKVQIRPPTMKGAAPGAGQEPGDASKGYTAQPRPASPSSRPSTQATQYQQPQRSSYAAPDQGYYGGYYPNAGGYATSQAPGEDPYYASSYYPQPQYGYGVGHGGEYGYGPAAGMVGDGSYGVYPQPDPRDLQQPQPQQPQQPPLHAFQPAAPFFHIQ